MPLAGIWRVLEISFLSRAPTFLICVLFRVSPVSFLRLYTRLSPLLTLGYCRSMRICNARLRLGTPPQISHHPYHHPYRSDARTQETTEGRAEKFLGEAITEEASGATTGAKPVEVGAEAGSEAAGAGAAAGAA